jgi:hypothetical protein
MLDTHHRSHQLHRQPIRTTGALRPESSHAVRSRPADPAPRPTLAAPAWHQRWFSARGYRPIHRCGALLLLAALLLALPSTLGHAHPLAASETSLTLVSAAGDPWTDAFGHTGPAVLTFGHIGCDAVDLDGFCEWGFWNVVTIPDAHWIWTAQNITPEEARVGAPPVSFRKTFTLPSTATNRWGEIRITVDDAYQLYLNGVFVGAGTVMPPDDWTSVETFALQPRPGLNTLEVRAVSIGYGPERTPYDNPSGVLYRADIRYTAGPQTVPLDIKPGDATNHINLASQGVIPVAILTTPSLDATTVEPQSVCFGDAEDAAQRACGAARRSGHREDVNRDGQADLVLHFETQQTGIDLGDTTAVLTGTTVSGDQIVGQDGILVRGKR